MSLLDHGFVMMYCAAYLMLSDGLDLSVGRSLVTEDTCKTNFAGVSWTC